MPRIAPKPGPGTPFARIMALRPDIQRSWNALDERIRFSGLLDAELKEEVRRALAQQSGCAFCASLGRPAAHGDPKTSAALAFAGKVIAQPKGVDEAAFDALRIHFSNEEIVELTAWIAFMVASEMFGAMYKLDPATPEEAAMYSRWLRKGSARASIR
jgi:alkylhydroperoxidase family enzyme